MTINQGTIPSPLSWQEIFAQRLGLRFDGQPQLLSVAVRRLCELTGMNETTLRQQMLDSELNDEIWQVVSDHVVVSSSRFFRDPEIFQAISNWLQTWKLHGSDPLVMMSLGAADGREAYSLAMLADDMLSGTKVNWHVWGYDISYRALQQAQNAHYYLRQLDGTSEKYINKYFIEDRNELWSPIDKLREHVTFNHTFLDGSFETMNPHLVCCLNTLMYMTTEQQKFYLNWFEDRLMPGGMVLLSPVDVSWWRPEKLQPFSSNKVRAFVKPMET
jgi:chemotaxis methyl-accepting protein methylase